MATQYDFSKALVRCHGIYYIVSDGKEKSPKQKYEYLCAVLMEEMAKYDAMDERRRAMKTGLSKAAKIAGLEYEIGKLETTKHMDPLSTGAKSYLKRLYGYLKYGKWSASKEKGNKYLTKGKLAEQDALDLISQLDGIEFQKNTVRVDNDFLSGIPDTFIGESIFKAEYVPDVKCSWDWETFAENIGKPLNPVYWWQEQGYFDLTGAKEGEISFCLVNTPSSILEQERYNLAKRLDAITMETEVFKIAERELINNLTFDDIPASERRLRFLVSRDDVAIEKIHQTVPKCREYLFELQEMHLSGIFTDKELPILDTIEEI